MKVKWGCVQLHSYRGGCGAGYSYRGGGAGYSRGGAGYTYIGAGAECIAVKVKTIEVGWGWVRLQ